MIDHHYTHMALSHQLLHDCIARSTAQELGENPGVRSHPVVAAFRGLRDRYPVL